MTARNTTAFSGLNENLNLYALQRRRQVRIFAFVWMGITLIIGAITFAGIYTATGIAARAAAGSGNVNVNQNQVQPPAPAEVNPAVAAAQITATPFPTIEMQPSATAAPVQPSPEPTAQPAAPAATVPAIQDTAFDLGIAIQKNPDPNVYKLWVEMAGQQLKLNWVKSQVVWRDVEKVKGQFDFGELDTSMNLLAEGGMKVMLSITKAPDWARDVGAKIQPGVFDGPPANPADFAAFLTAILTRYPGKVHAIEVWNEINIDREWATQPTRIDARRYVELLRTARDAIKAVDPNIVVISAGLAPTGANIAGAVTDDFVYMDELIAAGMLTYVDCVGAHHNGLNVPPTADFNNIPERNPRAQYRGPWDNPHHSWSFKSTLEGYARKIQAAGSTVKLCVTEFGWPSLEDLAGRGTPREGFGFAGDNSLADQALFTQQAIELMQQWGFIRLAFVWNLNYGAQAGWQLGDATGDNVLWSILGPDYAPRPVWQVIVNMDFRSRIRQAQ